MKRTFAQSAFTLVELLIVIALIAILSVAVLATINPIEQSNKAKDSTVQNDAAEVLNAYERYYANNQTYPWQKYINYWSGTGNHPTVEDAMVLPSSSFGFGICDVGATNSAANTVTTCNPQSTTPGTLIEGDELKNSFVNKAEFTTAATNPENRLWTFKVTGSGGSIYVCYIPKAKSNRQQSEKLYCIYDPGNAAPDLCKAGATCNGRACVALAATAATWGTPVFNGLQAMYRCVPE